MSTTPSRKGRGFGSMTVGARDKSLEVLEREIFELGGEPRQILDRLRRDPDYRRALVLVALRDGLGESTPQQAVRAIMGTDNFFGPSEWISLYDRRFTRKQLREVNKLPFAVSELLESPCPFYTRKKVKETHFVFCGIDSLYQRPLTIMEWREIHHQSAYLSFTQELRERVDFAFATDVTCNFHWYVMLKGIVPGSRKKPWLKQLVLLPPEYGVPTAVEEVTKIILYFRKNGRYPYMPDFARCRYDSPERDCWGEVCCSARGISAGGGHLPAAAVHNVGISAYRRLYPE